MEKGVFELNKDGKLNLYEFWKTPRPFYIVCAGEYYSRIDYEDVDEKTFNSTYKKTPFRDYDWFYTHIFDADDEIGDYIYHNLFSDYYGCRYTNVYNFRTPFMSIHLGDDLEFSDDELKTILSDYNHLIKVNNPPFSLSNEDVLILLSSLSQYKPIPALGYSGELNPPIYCFWTVEDVEKIPLLLLLAIFKNVFGFKSWDCASHYFVDYAIMWIEEGKYYFSAFIPTWADAASKFSGYPIEEFDKEHLGCNTPFNTDRYELPSANYLRISLEDLNKLLGDFDKEGIKEEASIEEPEEIFDTAPEPYVEQEIEKWNPTPNPYTLQIEQLEKQKRTIVRSRKKIVKYILPIAIPGGVSLILLYIGILISSLSHSFVGGLIIPGIILLTIALIFLPFLIKAGKHNKVCNQKFRKTNLEIADLQKKSEEFDKQQKKEKAEYDARVAKQVAENARRKAEYEAAVAKQAQENARRKAERDAAIKRQVANENAKHFNAPTKSSKANKKLSDFSICIHAIYKGYDVCCVTSKVTNNILPLYQPGFTFFDVLKNGNLSKIKEYVKDPVVLGYFVVGVFVSQFCGEEIFKMSLKEKKDTIQFLKERLSPESYKQITSDTNLHKDILESLWDKEFVDLIKRIGLFDDYLSCFNIENALDEQSNAPLTLSILPDDKEEASLTASLNFDIDLEEMKIDDFSYLDLFFDLNPYSQNYDFFNDMESSDVGTIVCQLPYRFFNKELPNSYDLQASFNNDITEAEKEYVRDSLESECPNNLEDYEDIYEYIDCLSQGDRVNLLKDGKHYLIMKMPLGIFESLNCNDGHDCSDIDFDSECYTNDIYMDCRKEYFSSDYFLLGKKQIKKQTKLTKEELVEMILSKLGKDPKELEESNEGLKLLDYYYKRYGDTDYISDLRALLFETPYLFFDYLDVETPWYSPNYVKEFDYNLKEKQPNPFWQPEKKLNEEYKKRCVEYFKHYKTNIGNDSNVEKEYKAMLDHIITNVVYSRNGSIEEQDLSVLSNITGIKITMSDIGTHKSQEKTSVVKKEQPMKDGDIYVDYLYCDEDSACQVIKLIYRIAVNKKHKIQTDIYSLRYEAAYAFSSDFDSFETYRFEEDPNILYDEVIDARDLGDISAHLDNLEFDDFSLEDLDKLNPEEYDELYNQVYFKVD